MNSYTVTLSDAENQSLAYVTLSQQDWIDNAVHDRCRVAMDEIVQITVQKCLETNTPIPGTKEDIVMLGFQMGWVKTAEERQQESQPII